MTEGDLIRMDFVRIAPRADRFAAAVYDKLFEVAPQVRELFAPDLTEQRRHLLRIFKRVVNHADNLDKIADELAALGTRHVEYGAKDEYYPVVRDVIIAALESFLGDEWTHEHREAWESVLNEMAQKMLAGARQKAA